MLLKDGGNTQQTGIAGGPPLQVLPLMALLMRWACVTYQIFMLLCTGRHSIRHMTPFLFSPWLPIHLVFTGRPLVPPVLRQMAESSSLITVLLEHRQELLLL